MDRISFGIQLNTDEGANRVRWSVSWIGVPGMHLRRNTLIGDETILLPPPNDTEKAETNRRVL